MQGLTENRRTYEGLFFPEEEKGKATRQAFGEALEQLGEKDPKIVALDADLSSSTKSCLFKDSCRANFFNMGLQESNLIGTAVGFALSGFIPFVSTFAVFISSKGFEQIRLGAGHSGANVKLVGSHGGITVGEDGPTHHAIEDLALLQSVPNILVCVPADEVATKHLTPKLAYHDGPVYIRCGRPSVPLVYKRDYPHEFAIDGGSKVLIEGDDVAIFAAGRMVHESLLAAKMLEDEGVSATVIDTYVINPLDSETVATWADRCGAAVTAEEHLIHGGLTAKVATLLGMRAPVPLEAVALHGYTVSGPGNELLEINRLTAKDIAAAARRAASRKRD